MPRALAEVGRERTIATLARNLFEFTGPNATADRRRAEAALLRDNPQLANRENFRSGMRIIVPTDLGLRTTERVRRPDVDLPGLIDDGDARLAGAEAAIMSSLERRAAQTAQALDRLRDRRFLAAARESSPAAAERLTAVRGRLEQEAEAQERVQAALAHALTQASAELARLRAFASGGNSPPDDPNPRDPDEPRDPNGPNDEPDRPILRPDVPVVRPDRPIARPDRPVLRRTPRRP